MSPATLIVPIELPGAMVPETMVSPTVPVPCKRPVDQTSSAPPSLPFTASVPASTSVEPVKPLESPVSSVLPEPI